MFAPLLFAGMAGYSSWVRQLFFSGLRLLLYFWPVDSFLIPGVAGYQAVILLGHGELAIWGMGQ